MQKCKARVICAGLGDPIIRILRQEDWHSLSDPSSNSWRLLSDPNLALSRVRSER